MVGQMTVIMRAGKCGHHFDADCSACQASIEVTDCELDRLRAENRRLRDALFSIKNYARHAIFGGWRHYVFKQASNALRAQETDNGR